MGVSAKRQMGERARRRRRTSPIRSPGRMKRLKLITPAARIRASPVRPFAVSPSRLLPPGSWILAPFVAGPLTLSDN